MSRSDGAEVPITIPERLRRKVDREYSRLVAELRRRGRIDRVDSALIEWGALLTAMCDEAYAAINRDGMMVDGFDEDGVAAKVAHPMLQRICLLMDESMAAWNAMGLTYRSSLLEGENDEFDS